MVTTVLVVCCGVGAGTGSVFLYRAVRGQKTAVHGREATSNPARTGRKTYGRTLGTGSALSVLLVAIVGVVTRWPALMVLAAVTGFGLPHVVRATKASDDFRQTEAIASWTELLRDTLAAASGLSQAIIATAGVAPKAIAAEVNVLALRLKNGASMTRALRAFADDVEDPACDVVVSALVLASTARAQKLVDLLGALAGSMRDEVAMRLRVESARSSARSSVRTIIFFTFGFAVLVALFSSSYLQPFGTLDGQIALVVAGAFDAAGVALMLRLVGKSGQGRLIEEPVTAEAIAEGAVS